MGAQIVNDMLDVNKMREKLRANTFVEVKFQEHAEQTVAEEGAAPKWHGQLTLPFRAPQDDFTPANLTQVRDVVTFMLFDKVSRTPLLPHYSTHFIPQHPKLNKYFPNINNNNTTLCPPLQQVVEDDSKTGGILEGESPERVERRFLGHFQLPALSTSTIALSIIPFHPSAITPSLYQPPS